MDHGILRLWQVLCETQRPLLGIDSSLYTLFRASCVKYNYLSFHLYFLQNAEKTILTHTNINAVMGT